MTGLDNATLFAANIVTLLTMSAAFLAAWTRDPGVPYWPTWIWANLLIAGSLAAFLAIGPWPTLPMAPLANLLYVAGYAMRLRAARQFCGRAGDSVPLTVVPVLVAAVLFLYPSMVGYRTAQAICCAFTTLQIAAIVREFWRDHDDVLPSCLGLTVSYLPMGAGALFRVAQEAFASAGLENPVVESGPVTFLALLLVLHTAGTGAFSLSIAFERKAERHRRLALTDGLTQLPNRRAFEERLARAVADRRGDASLAMLDIDHFKRINDTYGHAAGDAALRACGIVLSGALPRDAFLARTGGEEFSVLIEGRTVAETQALLEGLRRAVEAAVVAVDARFIRMTVSIGVLHRPDGFEDPDACMRMVDDHLYAAKRNGRNRLAMAA